MAGKSPELNQKTIEKFQTQCQKNNIQNTYVHTPYYINLASSNNRIRYGSSRAIREELERASTIGARYVMTHLGSTKELGRKEGIEKTIKMLNKSLGNYTGNAKLILENSAGAGEIIGDTFSEINTILTKISSENIAGICLDTQHSFASGYDWTQFENAIEKIDKEIGLNKIKLIHANDSQTDCGSNKDRHEHIGEGKIGKKAFEKITAFAQNNNIDMICETRDPGVKNDIATLKKIRQSLEK